MKRTGLTLERELLDLLGAGRKAHIAARYYGFDGRGGGSLQAVGNEIGVTRERIRQLVSAASEGARTGRPVSPTLDHTIAFVVDHMPAAAGEIEAEMLSQRLTSDLFRLEGVINAAELLGRRVPFSITPVKGERLVHARGVRSVKTIVVAARRVISRCGITTISDVVAEREVASGGCDSKLVVSALACLAGFHWLEHSEGWFWLSDNYNNAALNRIRKILSLANPIHISELRAGISRDPTMKGLSPPEGVLLEFCRQAPGLRVEDEMVKAAPAIHSDDVLTPTERDIVRLLSEHGGTIASSKLTPLCRGLGANRRTFFHNLAFSPIFAKYGAGLYGLIGSGGRSADPTRVAVELLSSRTSSSGECEPRPSNAQ
jgi:hypothetical protein